MPKSHFGKRERSEKADGGKWRDKKDKKDKKENKEAEDKPPVDESQQLFTRRLQKSQLKDLEKELRTVSFAGGNTHSIKDQINRVKKAVFTDERRLDDRKKGFEKAKVNVKRTALSEFM